MQVEAGRLILERLGLAKLKDKNEKRRLHNRGNNR